ncbi:small ribosomal subunit Rsm22 family protein [Haloglomus litoreum]|uniref:small ribosomal subunit Rsm22 family protein n=1 Tax=Haloglomus litoreum TaxID=3034026 RepID=UPI0023E81441|nr:class I SAM-dependent methyltransferase [Haloglomus sp. DT116]
MDETQRSDLRDTARYLRSVRPIDPEEVFEYVEGQPHPAVVTQELRALAPDLGLVETDDRTFVPVSGEPVPAWRARGVDERVTALPDAHATRLEDLLVERYGAGWPDGESGDRLRRRLREVKEHYLHGGAVEYDDETALAYAVYHLPGYYASVQYVLDDLAKADLLGHHLRVLDVGAGVGGPALGLADYLPDEALLDYHAVEPAAAADVLESLLGDLGRNVHPTVHRETAEAFDPAAPLDDAAVGGDDAPAGWDLILFSNVLSELEDPSGTARRYLDALAPDGSFLALAPADRNTALGLRGVERALADHSGEDAATVWAPTLRLWPDAAPADTCWSFDVRPDLEVPGFQRSLDRGERGPDAGEATADPAAADDRAPGDGEFVNVDVQFSYSVLRRDGRQAIDFQPAHDRFARLADSEAHVTDRVNVAAVKLSHDLTESPDANPLFRIGDGSQTTDHFAVLVDEDSLNAPLREADYGDLLTFERVLVLWNDDERAYNLVVDEAVVVESVPVPP